VQQIEELAPARISQGFEQCIVVLALGHGDIGK
jgi:hypothetical protein